MVGHGRQIGSLDWHGWSGYTSEVWAGGGPEGGAGVDLRVVIRLRMEWETFRDCAGVD
jgi:hypothetical protein